MFSTINNQINLNDFGDLSEMGITGCTGDVKLTQKSGRNLLQPSFYTIRQETFQRFLRLQFLKKSVKSRK